MNNRFSELATSVKEIATKPPIIGLTALTATQLACEGEGFLIAAGAGILLMIVGGLYVALRPSAESRAINKMANSAESSPYSRATHAHLRKLGNPDSAINASGGDVTHLKH